MVAPVMVARVIVPAPAVTAVPAMVLMHPVITPIWLVVTRSGLVIVRLIHPRLRVITRCRLVIPRWRHVIPRRRCVVTIGIVGTPPGVIGWRRRGIDIGTVVTASFVVIRHAPTKGQSRHNK